VSCLPSLLHPAAGLFAQASFSTNLDDVTSAIQSVGKRTGMDLHDELALIGSLVLVAGLVFFLTAVFRKRHHHHHRDRRDYAPPPPARPRENAVAENGKIRRRKRRRDHRPRNPTRAEAGGLPPRREGEEDLPPA